MTRSAASNSLSSDQRITEDGQHRGVAAQRPRLVHELEASGALLQGCGREMVDDTLNMRPGGKRGRERMVRIPFHRAIEQFERAGIAVGIEREHAGHRPQREVVRAEVGRRLAQRVIDLGQPQAWLQRRRDPGREMLLGWQFRRRRTPSARCAQSWPPVSVSISLNDQAASGRPFP